MVDADDDGFVYEYVSTHKVRVLEPLDFLNANGSTTHAWATHTSDREDDYDEPGCLLLIPVTGRPGWQNDIELFSALG